MLSVFQKSIAEGPQELSAPESGDGFQEPHELLKRFKNAEPGAVTISINENDFISYTMNNQNPHRPRSFACVDNIFGLFEGDLENLPHLRQQYGLGRSTNEVHLVIELYRVLRDRAPYPADQAVKDLRGAFYFIILDNLSKTVFIAAGTNDAIPFYWGKTANAALAFSNDAHLLKAGCGQSFAPFPKGCYFTSMGGLLCYEHPLTPLKAVPHVDSQGQLCGSMFKPDSQRSPKKFGNFGSFRQPETEPESTTTA